MNEPRINTEDQDKYMSEKGAYVAGKRAAGLDLAMFKSRTNPHPKRSKLGKMWQMGFSYVQEMENV
jgi:hypothetical protein